MKLIGIFKTACPAGWTRVSAWDGKFIRAESAPGATGGADTHTHTVDFANQVTGDGYSYWSGIDGRETVPLWLGGHLVEHTHTVNPAAVTTTSVSTLPPYIEVVFCSREVS